jgi:hypothetical protein
MAKVVNGKIFLRFNDVNFGRIKLNCILLVKSSKILSLTPLNLV